MKRQFFVDPGSAMSHNLDNWKARGSKRVRTGWAVFFVCLSLICAPTCLADSQQKFPGKGSRADWERANRMNHEALLLGRSNQLDAAIAKTKAAIAIYPFDSSYFYNCGNFLADQKKFAEAVEQYQNGLVYEPRDFDALYNLGLAYRGLKNNKMAEASYRKALSVRPDDFDAIYNLGNVLRDELRFDESRAMYERASRVPGASSQRMTEAYRMLDEKIGKNGGSKH